MTNGTPREIPPDRPYDTIVLIAPVANAKTGHTSSQSLASYCPWSNTRNVALNEPLYEISG